MVEMVTERLDSLDFNVKYPIQEKYYGMIYSALYKALLKLKFRKGGDSDL